MRIELILYLIITISGVLIQIPQTTWTKCFRSQSSPDKSLQLKFGIFKRYKNSCQLQFSIKQHDKFDKIVQSIHQQQYYCSAANPGNPIVIKHTSKQLSFGGYYSICIEIVSNMNAQALVQISIGQKLNPVIYSQANTAIPLVQNRQLMDLQMTVESIKRSLVSSQNYIVQSTQMGAKLDVKINNMMAYNNMVTILQIILLVMSGIAWIILVSRIKSPY